MSFLDLFGTLIKAENIILAVILAQTSQYFFNTQLGLERSWDEDFRRGNSSLRQSWKRVHVR